MHFFAATAAACTVSSASLAPVSLVVWVLHAPARTHSLSPSLTNFPFNSFSLPPDLHLPIYLFMGTTSELIRCHETRESHRLVGDDNQVRIKPD